jgi:uncharacterized protein YcbK (DUF882 family)
MNRRFFLKNSLNIIGTNILTKSVFAEDYSIKENTYQPHYIYNPFEAELNELNINQNYIIQNDILPKKNLDFWSQPRKINLYRTETAESAEVIYHANGKLNEREYYYVCHLLRDVKQNKAILMDPKLLDLICATQAWLKYYGYNGPIYINSGYRTAITNRNLEGAAKNSMHLYGKAVDFRVPGLTPIQIAKIAAKFQAGGIGIYLISNFIHLDTGGVRIWIKK